MNHANMDSVGDTLHAGDGGGAVEVVRLAVRDATMDTMDTKIDTRNSDNIMLNRHDIKVIGGVVQVWIKSFYYIIFYTVLNNELETEFLRNSIGGIKILRMARPRRESIKAKEDDYVHGGGGARPRSTQGAMIANKAQEGGGIRITGELLTIAVMVGTQSNVMHKIKTFTPMEK